MSMSSKPQAPGPTASGYAGVDAPDAASAEPASSCRPGEQDDRSPPPGPTLHIHGDSVPSFSTATSSFSSSSSSSPPNPPPSEVPSKPRRNLLPIALPPFLFQRGKTPSTSVAPSTAEGKPAPLAGAADAHRSSALQKLNSKYPSSVRRHGYTPEAASAQSSTYSQPVLVRTYSGPSPSQRSRSSRARQYRPPSSGRGVSRRVPLPSGDPGQPIRPTVSDVGVSTTSRFGADLVGSSTETYAGSPQAVSMPRTNKPKTAAATSTSKLPLPWLWGFASSRQEPEEPKLPPLEAFSFKSFMADLEARGGDHDIGADLDRIAEICARSRYSLSNQYEVHVAPHGSGSSFMSAVGPSTSSAPRRKGHGHNHSRSRSHGQGGGGPTLQAIPSDDENSARSHPRRRTGGGRRRSAAYGTLETIMSSSRSSEEEKSKKKSASELVGEVRGRAARKAWDNPSGSGSGSASASTGNGVAGGSADTTTTGTRPEQQATRSTGVCARDDGGDDAAARKKLPRKKSASFAAAVMDSGRSSSDKKTSVASFTSSRQRTASATAATLRSEPALPQTSHSHLGVRTTTSTAARDATAMTTATVTGISRDSASYAVRSGDEQTINDLSTADESLPSANPGLAASDSTPTGAVPAFAAAGAAGGRNVPGSWGGAPSSWIGIPWRSGPVHCQVPEQPPPSSSSATTTTASTAAAAAQSKQDQRRSRAEGSLRQLLRAAAPAPAVGAGQAGLR